jgi:hypothetical protein
VGAFTRSVACLQRPIVLKGHERPITWVQYNREGDLLFTMSKDKRPTVWYADNGERLGSYEGHSGAVWQCDVTREWRDGCARTHARTHAALAITHADARGVRARAQATRGIC